MKDENWRWMDDSRASLAKMKEACDKAIGSGTDAPGEEERKMLEKDIMYKDFPISFEGKADGKSVREDTRLVVTFSAKYYMYQQRILARQIESAKAIIRKGRAGKYGPNDVRRLLSASSVTKEGEVGETTVYSLDEERIEEERSYFGFYSLATSLDDGAQELLRVNARRWKIEECFRVMKTSFRARPVYVSTEPHIRAHFAICFLALLVYRLLEERLDRLYLSPSKVESLKAI